MFPAGGWRASLGGLEFGSGIPQERLYTSLWMARLDGGVPSFVHFRVNRLHCFPVASSVGNPD